MSTVILQFPVLILLILVPLKEEYCFLNHLNHFLVLILTPILFTETLVPSYIIWYTERRKNYE